MWEDRLIKTKQKRIEQHYNANSRRIQHNKLKGEID